MPFKNAYACKNVEIPPKDIIKVAIIVAKFELIAVEARSRQPLVISPSPHKMAVNNEEFNPMLFSMLQKWTNIGLEMTTSSKTNVKHITPPINSIEFIDDITLCEKSKSFVDFVWVISWVCVGIKELLFELSWGLCLCLKPL